MRLTYTHIVFSLSLVAGLLQGVASNVLQPRRTTSILNNPDAQPDLPAPQAAAQAAAAESLNLDNIQGDILVGMKKKKELFLFFSIKDVKSFKKKLGHDIHPLVTTTTQLLDVAKQPTTALNIAFSQSGLSTLGITDNLGDTAFAGGQFADAAALGDPGTTNWVSALKGTSVHGVILLASDSDLNTAFQSIHVLALLGSSISVKYTLGGSARPGSQEGHEHFGFMDGISQPAVSGFNAHPTPGQTLIDPGHILLGESGDTITRPAWAKDGSFLAFRQLKQLVPEFDKFLTDNPLPVPGLTKAQGSALLGARMIGRWKSGAPIDLAPLFDDPVLAADPQRNNDFTFAHPGEDLKSNQTRCPFSAHVRKTRPRADFNPVNTNKHIIRAGIPYGPEVNALEKLTHKTLFERGLAFVSYQSNLNDGFRFIQTAWANNAAFIFGKNDSTPGVDPIIGALGGAQRPISGLDPTNPNRDITLMKDFVVSRGGEYFFAPSLSAISGTLAV